jgi:DNA repair protein RecO (recombination protein O)
MLNKRYSTEGIVLGKVNYGEADRILTLFTKDQGKVRVIAKGVRKIKSRKRGHLEVFNQIRFSAMKWHDMDMITEAELIEAHSEVKKDLRKVSVAYYLVEIISKLTQTEEKHEFLYYFLAEKLHELNDSRSLKTFRLKAACDLLMQLGFWPDGKVLDDPDAIIESLIEKKLSSIRIGKSITI